MPTFNFRKTYADGKTPKTRDLDNLIDSIVSGINNTKLDAQNFQDGAITTSKIASAAITNTIMPSVGQQISSSSSSFSTSSTSYVDVTNLSVSITTTGRPVMIALVPDSIDAARVAISAATGTADGQIAFDRGGTNISVFNINAVDAAGSTSQISIPASACKYVDTPSSGTYTYKCRAKLDTGDFVLVYNCKLIAYEL